MKKIFAILLALCLFTSLLPMTVMAETPSIKVYFRNSGKGGNTTFTLNPGDTVYVTTTDAQVFAKWSGTEAPEDHFVKVEYPAGDKAVLNVTMKNIDYLNEATGDWSSHAIEFAKADYDINITLEGANKMQGGSICCIKINTTGCTTFTGSGSLTTLSTGSTSGSIVSRYGDLVFKNTTLDFTVSYDSGSLHHAILSNGGNVTFDGAKVTSNTTGGCLVYFGEPQKTGDQVGRYTPDEDDTRKVTIKDSEITATTKKKNNIIVTAAPAVISNSTLKLKNASSASGAMISPAPTFEGEYTAIAGLAKNADKLDKLKEYDAKKNTSYSYLYIVPGIQNLIPTTAPTEPSVETQPPAVTQPTETQPVGVTKPAETKPAETKPAETKPAETTPNTNKPVDTHNNGNSSGETLKIILFVLLGDVVVVAATFGVLFFLKKKKAK